MLILVIIAIIFIILFGLACISVIPVNKLMPHHVLKFLKDAEKGCYERSCSKCFYRLGCDDLKSYCKLRGNLIVTGYYKEWDIEAISAIILKHHNQITK